MTLSEIKNELVDFFSKNDIITVKDFKNIVVITENFDTELKKLLIIKALEDFEKDNIVSKISIKETECWVLKQPLYDFKQSVEIPGDLANYISEVLGKVYLQLGEKISPPNKLNITTNDIISLASILDNLTNKND